MADKIFALIALIFLVMFPFLLANPQARVCFDINCFEVEVAGTQKQREQGLMFRQNLPENQGMLFVFEKEDIYYFWMKNTFIPLDIIWIDSENKIIFISKNVQPCPADLSAENKCPGYGPDKKSKYVLEISGGLADKLGLETGQKMLVDNLRP